MGSLRNRLLLGAGIVIILGIVASDVVIYSAARSTLNSEFDQSLHSKAIALSNEIEFTEEGLELDVDQTNLARENSFFFQAWREDGTVLARSHDFDLSKVASQGFTSIELPDGRHGRQIAMSFFPKIEEELLGEDDDADSKADHLAIPPEVLNSKNGRIDELVSIVVAASTEAVDALVSKLLWLLLIVAAAALTASLLLILTVVSRSLRPLKRIAKNIESIDEESLTNRVSSNEAPHEIAPIINRLNGLLDRIKSVLSRERAFSTDVSHELRTPLAGIKSTIEVCLSRPREPDEYREALSDCQRICDQSQQMVESLLAITHLETDNARCDRALVNLPRLIDACWNEFEKLADEKNATLALFNLEPISIETDAEKLRVIVRNLLQNAVSHCDENGSIRISSACTNGSVNLVVENTGNKIEQDQIPALFDRFWRGDESRSNTGDHFGLGLSLVDRLVFVLNGTIEIDVAGSNFRAVVTLPIRQRSNIEPFEE